MTTRAGDIGSLVFGRSRRGSFRRVLVALLIVSGLLLYVGGKVQIVQLGYQIEVLEREKHELERANRSLLIEASSLSSPERIEEIAIKRLGMVRPAKENVVIVKRKRDRENSKNQIPNTK
jgi:cell division protein FtsL